MSRTPVIGPALLAAAPAWPESCTLRQMAERAQVGYESARHMVPKLHAAGELLVAGEARVDYRNRPVQLYQRPADGSATVPATATGPQDDGEGMSTAEIQLFMQGWPG